MPAATAEPPAVSPPPTAGVESPLRVVPGGEDFAPYIPLSAERAESISALLTDAGVRNWVQLPYPSLAGGWKAKLLLTYGADVTAVQQVLDGAADR